MTKLFLAAGVAALAIAAPASAGPDRQGGQAAKTERAKADRSAQRAKVDRSAQRAQATERGAARANRASKVQSRQAVRTDRAANRVDRATNRTARLETRQADRRVRTDNRQARIDSRPARMEARQIDRAQRTENRMAIRDQLRADRGARLESRRIDNRLGYGAGGCPPGLAKKPVACMPPGQAAKLGLTPVITAQNAAVLRAARVDGLNRRLGMRLAAPVTAASLLGLPVTRANAILPLAPIPQPISYLYPSTPDYYYRYGNGYVYQVDAGSSLISALIPLLAGGLLPGQYLPANYMNSYVPNYYGYNSFYPNSPYQCTRYANGVVYYVDCATGLIENVMPLYDSGYGVGQMLPSTYGYYNVPTQYRSLYYDTPNAGYWYAPGAIYQYDRSSSLITSVAALLSPGMTIGQPMPMGYGAYNVPLGYRDMYYDTPNSWYRYSNGYVYQVDPTTRLVTAIVASILT